MFAYWFISSLFLIKNELANIATIIINIMIEVGFKYNDLEYTTSKATLILLFKSSSYKYIYPSKYIPSSVNAESIL